VALGDTPYLLVARALPPVHSPAAGRGDPDRGRLALHQYACNTCHEIPGVTGVEFRRAFERIRMVRKNSHIGGAPGGSGPERGVLVKIAFASYRALGTDVEGCGFALPTSSPLRQELNLALLEAIESDWWDQTLFQYLGRR